jgi:4-alpha-glucanotransferase
LSEKSLPESQTLHRDSLLKLALYFGIDPEYQTVWGHMQGASSEVLHAALEAISGGQIPAALYGDPEAADKWIAERKAQRLAASPVLAEDSRRPLESLDTSSLAEGLTIEVQVRWEGGQQDNYQCTTRQGKIDIPAGLLEAAKPGYHHLELTVAGKRESYDWILSPPECYAGPSRERYAGLACFLPSLRSKQDWGVGDFAALRLLGQSFQGQGFDFVGLNPLHALANRIPYNASPYSPLSLMAMNWIYLAIEDLPEFASSSLAQKLFHEDAIQEQIRRLREAPTVNYEGVSRLKLFFLAILYREFLRHPDPAFARWRETREPWLTQLGTYLAFWRYWHRRNPGAWVWQEWPAAYQAPHSQESRNLAAQLRRHIDFHAWIQWRLEIQKEAAHQELVKLGYRLGLYCDLPVACDKAGPDRWANAQLFAQGIRVGSPPDGFNPGGQDWGFPSLRPLPHCPENIHYFRASIAAVARSAGVIRLDHVMRLARLYSIPDGFPATDGVYIREQFEALLRMIALESHRNQVMVVGEDLGTVPDYFREALHEFGILSYRLTMFEWNQDGLKPAAEYPATALCSFTTHDLATFDGYLHAEDIEARRRIGWLNDEAYAQARESRRNEIAGLSKGLGLEEAPQDADGMFAALLRFLCQTPCRIVLVNLDELLGERHQMNLPGSTHEYPNWQRKAEHPLEQFQGLDILSKRIQAWKAIWMQEHSN